MDALVFVERRDQGFFFGLWPLSKTVSEAHGGLVRDGKAEGRESG